MEQRFYKDMKNTFASTSYTDDNTLIYEFNNIIPVEEESDLLYGITTIYPGTIDGEYFMTKGHYHTEYVAEVYYGISGKGIIYQQDKDGNEISTEIKSGEAVYVKPGFGHRTINTGDEPLVFFCVCRADCGHDYSINFNKRFFKS